MRLNSPSSESDLETTELQRTKCKSRHCTLGVGLPCEELEDLLLSAVGREAVDCSDTSTHTAYASPETRLSLSLVK